MKIKKRGFHMCILIFAVYLPLLISGCGEKEISSDLLYPLEGQSPSLDGDFASADDFVKWFDEVSACTSISASYPKIEIYSGDFVECTAMPVKACHIDGTIRIAKNTDKKVLKHSFIHYLYFTAYGTSDDDHLRGRYLDCAGLVVE